jgi:hypothetical protein
VTPTTSTTAGIAAPTWKERLLESGRGDGVRGALVVMALGVAVLLGLTVGVVIQTRTVRLPLAILLVVVLALIAMVRPQLAVVLTLVYLMLMAMLRRMLIPLEAFTAFDPLLTVGPALAVVLFLRYTLMPGHRIAADPTSAVITVIILLSLLETFNPLGGGFRVGFLGLIYVGVPMLWFYVGRDLIRPPWTRRLGYTVLAIAVLEAGMGLWQMTFGFFDWDYMWRDYVRTTLGNYIAINVRGAVRAWASFSSIWEYSATLAVGIGVGISGALRTRRLLPLLPVPFLLYALFIEASRTFMVLAIFSVLVVIALGRRTRRRAWITALASLLLLVSVDVYVGHSFTAHKYANTQGQLVQHQVLGLTRPLDPSNSTLMDHLTYAWSGIRIALQHPTGLGPGAANLASDRAAGQSSNNTELDVTNIFIALGPAGGLLYTFLVVRVLWLVGRDAFRRRDPDSMIVIAVLVAAFGQWMNSGLYFIGPLAWTLIGASAGRMADDPPPARKRDAVATHDQRDVGLQPKLPGAPGGGLPQPAG